MTLGDEAGDEVTNFLFFSFFPTAKQTLVNANVWTCTYVFSLEVWSPQEVDCSDRSRNAPEILIDFENA